MRGHQNKIYFIPCKNWTLLVYGLNVVILPKYVINCTENLEVFTLSSIKSLTFQICTNKQERRPFLNECEINDNSCISTVRV